jgi:acetylornithine deacetylase/succinyl-diaminopimelate desuccinylase-like protein
MAHDDPTAEVTEVLQAFIRNACVNDGTADSGEEVRSADLVTNYLEGSGLDLEYYEPHAGRRSVLAKIEGSDPTAPGLMLMGHTDVVPVNPDTWSRDPFGGELVDGVVWGRGAVDMLNLTASMLVAFRRLADSGFRPRGTLSYLAVADEEASGTYGAEWLLEHELDALRTENVITESGGFQMGSRGGVRLPVMVEEKGAMWSKLTVKGTPGHGSQPHRTDNAVLKAAQIVQRIGAYRPPARVSETWRRFVEGMQLPAELADPATLDAVIEGLPIGASRLFHSCTHTTMSPNVSNGGTKVNMIPDRAVVAVDIRTLPGVSADDVVAMLADACGDLWNEVEYEIRDDGATSSPIDTPLWDAMSRVTGRLCEGSALVPMMMVGGTDNRYFRRAGAVGYGFGLFSERLRFEDFASMFHGNDERVDQESLRLSTELWTALAHDFLG